MSGWTWARVAVVAGATFVGGLVVGGLGPRSEVRALEAENFELQRKATRSGGAGSDLAKLLSGNLEPGMAEPGRPRRGGFGGGSAEEPTEIGVGEAGSSELDAEAPAADGVEPAAPPSIEDTRAAMREMVEARAAQARAALDEDVDPSPEQLAVIDQAVADMNTSLQDIARDFVDRSRSGEVVGRREAMGFGSELIDVLVTTEDRILGALTPEQRAMAREEATDPTAFVDASIVDMLSELENTQVGSRGP